MLTIAVKMLAAGFIAGAASMGSTIPAAPQTIISAAPYIENKIPHINRTTALERWIERLILLESNGKEKIKILDHNGLYSFGCLQFQKGTFEEYGLKYGFISPGEKIGGLIYDCNLQKIIAKKMIEENYDNWRHWYTSVIVKKLGLPPATEDKMQIAGAEQRN